MGRVLGFGRAGEEKEDRRRVDWMSSLLRDEAVEKWSRTSCVRASAGRIKMVSFVRRRESLDHDGCKVL
jgi:hypothetical protein